MTMRMSREEKVLLLEMRVGEKTLSLAKRSEEKIPGEITPESTPLDETTPPREEKKESRVKNIFQFLLLN